MPASEHLKLNVCECGHIHLSYKSLTLHFEKDEFLNYAAHVGRMASQISSPVSLGPARGAGARDTNCH
jgi:hypothetical protein